LINIQLNDKGVYEMKITIIGTGNMALGIGTRLVVGGHAVAFVGRDMGQALETRDAVQEAANSSGKAIVADLADPLGEVVILAVPFGANVDLVRQLGARLAGKVVVDIANPLKPTFDGLATAADTSSAELVAEAAADGAQVVKAFNTTFAGTLLSGQAGGQPLDVFIAGDDAAAKEKIATLVRDGGMRPIDSGPLQHARTLEGMQFLHIILQGSLGTNWVSGLKIVS
jgi:8-hydroxy-5-deazaflavin:NADPH oxidoreductase